MLSLLDTLVITIHYFIIDRQCFLYMTMVVGPGLLLLVTIWNQWLYDGLTENGRLKFSYYTFQSMLTIVLLVLLVFSSLVTIFRYKPKGYIPGVC